MRQRTQPFVVHSKGATLRLSAGLFSGSQPRPPTAVAGDIGGAVGGMGFADEALHLSSRERRYNHTWIVRAKEELKRA